MEKVLFGAAGLITSWPGRIKETLLKENTRFFRISWNPVPKNEKQRK